MFCYYQESVSDKVDEPQKRAQALKLCGEDGNFKVWLLVQVPPAAAGSLKFTHGRKIATILHRLSLSTGSSGK